MTQPIMTIEERQEEMFSLYRDDTKEDIKKYFEELGLRVPKITVQNQRHIYTLDTCPTPIRSRLITIEVGFGDSFKNVCDNLLVGLGWKKDKLNDETAEKDESKKETAENAGSNDETVGHGESDTEYVPRHNRILDGSVLRDAIMSWGCGQLNANDNLEELRDAGKQNLELGLIRNKTIKIWISLSENVKAFEIDFDDRRTAADVASAVGTKIRGKCTIL